MNPDDLLSHRRSPGKRRPERQEMAGLSECRLGDPCTSGRSFRDSQVVRVART